MSANNLSTIEFQQANGESSSLANYAGKVLLVVNTASKCGLTPQYEGLQQLYAKQKSNGLEILAFPANDFLEQEPGSNEDIQQFCSLNYQVEFPVFAKIAVTGEQKHPLYAALIAAQPERIGEGPWIKDLIAYGITPNAAPELLWNFEKFLIAKSGEVVARFAPDISAQDERLISAIDAELAK